MDRPKPPENIPSGSEPWEMRIDLSKLPTWKLWLMLVRKFLRGPGAWYLAGTGMMVMSLFIDVDSETIFTNGLLCILIGVNIENGG